MTDADLDRLEALANAATPGPWWAGVNDRDKLFATNIEPEILGMLPAVLMNANPHLANKRNDLVFCAAARMAVPALIAEIRRLRSHSREFVDHANRIMASVKEAGKKESPE